MGGGIQAVGSHPFTVDPAQIAPDVLRVMWQVLLERLGPVESARLCVAAQAVGLAGVYGALVSQSAALEDLQSAIERACHLCELSPDTYRRYGSHLCEAAAARQQQQRAIVGPVPGSAVRPTAAHVDQ